MPYTIANNFGRIFNPFIHYGSTFDETKRFLVHLQFLGIDRDSFFADLYDVTVVEELKGSVSKLAVWLHCN